MNGVTLALAITGVVLSVASLAWQASAFVLSGSRVKVTLRFGGMSVDDGATVTWEISTRGKDTGLGDGFIPVLIIQTNNAGRTDVDVMEWGLRLNGEATVLGNPDFNAPLPYRLLHGAQQSWYLGDDGVQNAVDAMVCASPIKAEGFARLGNGKTKRSKPFLIEKALNA